MAAAGVSSYTGAAGILHPEQYHPEPSSGWFSGLISCTPKFTDWGWGDRFNEDKFNIIIGLFGSLTSAVIKYRAAPAHAPQGGKTWCAHCLPECSCTSNVILLSAILTGLASGGLTWIGMSSTFAGITGGKIIAGTISAFNCAATVCLGKHSLDSFIDVCKKIKDAPTKIIGFIFACTWGMAAVMGKSYLTFDVVAHYMQGYLAAAAAAGFLANVTTGLLLGVAIFKLFTEIIPELSKFYHSADYSFSWPLLVCAAVLVILSGLGNMDYGGLNSIFMNHVIDADSWTARVMGFIMAIPRGALVSESVLNLFETSVLDDVDSQTCITNQPT
jgi:hypothetical protein